MSGRTGQPRRLLSAATASLSASVRNAPATTTPRRAPEKRATSCVIPPSITAAGPGMGLE
eukprot:scaffold229162_cov35-Tisochrysis_lutea.AAC.2